MQRQALSGLLWTKQSYLFDVNAWLNGDFPDLPPPANRANIRNKHWRHLNSMRVMTMPDKWEYPWFAAWDLAFHCVTFALVDPSYAKDQLWLLLFEQFQHPNGQIPAYEWEFSDLNPPVHAWAVWRVYKMDRDTSGKADRAFLERCFHKLLINFAWWINKVDREGNNIFEGGFLGLDNITVVDRSMSTGDGARARTGRRHRLDGHVLPQHDAHGPGTGQGQSDLRKPGHQVLPALRLCRRGHEAHGHARLPALGRTRTASSTTCSAIPTAASSKFRVRSLVGLIPLFAVERLEMDWIKPFKEFTACLEWFLKNRQDLVRNVVHTVEHSGGVTHALTIVNQEQIIRLLARVLDPNEFLSDYGVRSLSKFHERHPFEFDGKVVGYEAAEALTKIKGGNSNWRGPIWLPTNFLIIESLRKLGKAFGQSFQMCLPGSKRPPDAAGNGSGNSGSADSSVHAGERPTRQSWRCPAVSRSALARSRAVLRVLSRRHGRRFGGVASNRMDGPGGVAGG